MSYFNEEIDDELNSLDVDALSQNNLENQITSNAQYLLNSQLLENEESRLQRSANLLNKLLSKKRSLLKKLEITNRISIKQKLKEQISVIESVEIPPVLKDIKDIKKRISDISNENKNSSQTIKSQDIVSSNLDKIKGNRNPGETEKDYLIRTGQITAFGTKSEFVLEDDSIYTEENVSHENIPIGQYIKKEQLVDIASPAQDIKANDYNALPIENETEDLSPVILDSTPAAPNVIDVKNESSEEDNLRYHNSQDEYKPSEDERIPSDNDESYSSDKSEGRTERQDFYQDEDSYDELDIEEHISKKDRKSKTKASNAIDDGDEIVYQKRLNHWIKKRSENRKVDNNSRLEEYQKPHPDFKGAKLNDTFKIPGEIFSSLFNYQKTCVQWLHELYQQKCGGIIGDEMGLGKTIQIIAFLASLHHSNLLNGPIIIVCPATVMKQWCAEIHKWWPPFRTIILHSIGAGMLINKKKMSEEEMENIIINSNPNEFTYEDFRNSSKIKTETETKSAIDTLVEKVINDGHIIITTYVGLRIHAESLLKVNWDYAILDEGHKIRNPDSEISLTCKKIKTYNRIILSGTPIQNNLNELWSLFDFIYPGKLGTLPVFQQQFVGPINVGGYANATNIQVQTGYKCAIALRNLISPYLLRRVKADVAKDLPKKKEMVLFCKLTEYQRKKYIEFLNSRELEQIKRGKRQVLFGIDILRKICNHPDILDCKEEEKRQSIQYGDPKRSGKMQVVQTTTSFVEEKNYKTLLFTQSRQMLDILEEFISYKDKDLQGIKYLRMDGTTSISIRQTLVDKFNNDNDRDDNIDLFLLTTRVGGLGVNLIGANRIIIFDPDWNPSTDLQARERAWRIGQKREVSIYRLMINGTIEEKIYHRQIFKQFLTNKILLNDIKQKRFFKMHELHDLFTLGGENGYVTEEMEAEVRKNTNKILTDNDVTSNNDKKESDDFAEVAKFAGVSKLEGFYNGKEQEDEKTNEDDRLIKGLIGDKNQLISEDQIIDSHNKPIRLINKEAEKNAEDAMNALKRSRKMRKKYKIGVPTWTGKFGQAGKTLKKRKTLVNKNGKNKSIGSMEILANIRESQNRNVDITVEPETNTNTRETKLIEDNKEIIVAIENFLRNQPNQFSTSNAIIQNIKGIRFDQKEDVIRIRALLKKVARFDKIRKGWVLDNDLHEEFE
ncbi:hypothetical protein TBLA_0D01950 [Henningerozyma blattae CBS 6284]|uniref:DNA helicase n=1 Tax=Henningerozyma blattae (strain ATCC 34711 / CBS 6284 / DSM 70876 / NBRC 10599 / NRRL Y-10934 / UCD 77-7) TaxID=1071380 RepID=I2H2V1_HENB6|nr:hypothetical protein TBLA_0D01950 [Tetrapisispora blattae CBS 6284]CCH60703.1 hypothetical protein TBLA_0D01950 [Tetrapisispora blattae CBS 6284]